MALVTKGDLPHLAYTAVTVGLRAIPLALRWQGCDRAARQLGQLWYTLDRSSRTLAKSNMRAVLGDRLSEAEIEREVQRHFYVIALGKIMNDMLPDLSLEQLTDFLHVEGEEHLQAALARGRGALLLGMHFGLHGYIPLTLFQRLGYQFVAILGHEYPSTSWAYKQLVYPVRSRNWSQLPVVNADGSPQRALVEPLRKGQSVMIWPDLVNEELFRQPEPNVIRIPLLGKSMPFRTGAFRMEQWMKVPALPFVWVPREHGFTMRIEPPLTLEGDRSLTGLTENVRTYAGRLEEYILRYPGMWWQWRQERLMELMQPLPVERVAA